MMNLDDQTDVPVPVADANRFDSRELLTRRIAPTRARRQALARTSAADHVDGISEFHTRETLFVCRESGEYAHLLLRKMIQQVLRSGADEHEEVRNALEYGADPMRSGAVGDAARHALNAQEILSSASGGARRLLGVVFSIGQFTFFYALCSAGKTDLDGENAFTTALMDLIADMRPKEIVTGPFSRMLRVGSIGSGLREAMATYRVTLRCSESSEPMDLRTSSGKRDWDLLASAAEIDYLATLNRLLTGTVFEFIEGRWPRPENSLPLGYKKIGAKGVDEHMVEPDVSQLTVVRRLIELGASDLTKLEIADELSDLGVRSRKPGFGDRPPLLRDLGDPARGVTSLMSHLMTYLEGDYVVRYEMTIPHQDEFHGVIVHRHAPEDNGYLEFPLRFGVPDGGWHSRELIEAAIERQILNTTTQSRTWNRDLVKPLAGIFDWTEGDKQFVVHSSDQGYYNLRSRPASQQYTSTGRRRGFGDGEGMLLATFKAKDLHLAVSSALQQVSNAMTAEPCPEIPAPTTAEIEQHHNALSEASVAVQRAINGELHARSDEERERYRDTARSLHDRIMELREETATLQRRQRPEHFRILSAGQIAAVIVELEGVSDRAPTSLHATLRRLLVDCRIAATPGEPIATLTLNVNASTTNGGLRLGPLSYPVSNRALGERKGPASTAKVRNRRLAEILLLEDSSPDERTAVWRAEDFNARQFIKRMHDVLSETALTPAARSAIISCPVLEVRRAVLGPLLGSDIGHDLDCAFADEVTRIYRSRAFSWAKGWCPGGMTLRHAVLQFILLYAEDPDAGVDRTELESALQISPPSLYDLLNNDGGKLSPRPAIIDDIGGWYGQARSGHKKHPVGIKKCPHCNTRTLTQPLTVPEVPGGLLCTTCKRSQTSTITYPDDYFRPWDGPQNSRRLRETDPTDTERFESTRGRIIVGTRCYKVVVPSPHAPRAQVNPTR